MSPIRFQKLTDLRASFSHGRRPSRPGAPVDPLMGVVDRATFISRAEQVLAQAREAHQPLAFAQFDLSNFQEISLRWGETVGDRFLRDQALTICGNLLTTDIVGRLSAESVGVLMPQTRAEQALMLIQNVRRELLQRIKAWGFPVGLDVGIAAFVEPPPTLADLLKKADELLAVSRAKGGNTIQCEKIAP